MPIAIVLGVDTPIGLTLVRELGCHGVKVLALGRNQRALGFYSRYVHKSFIRRVEEQALVEQILHLASQYGANILLTISEGDILFINRHRDKFDKTLTVLVPPSEMIEQVLHKDYCLDVARQIGIETPKTWTVQSLEDVKNLQEEVSFPVILKWANPHTVILKLRQQGLGLKKIEYAHCLEELRSKLAVYENVGAYPLIQEFCSGYGLGQMFLIRNGIPILRFQHRRIHEWPPEGGVSSLCEAVSLEEHQSCQERSLSLLAALRWDGVAMVEYRYDPTTERYVLMEINGRFWGSQPLAFHAGAHFAWLWVAHTCGIGNDSQRVTSTGLRCRYIIPDTYRLLRILFHRDQIQLRTPRFSRLGALSAYILTFFSPRTRYYVFWRRDPKPFFADLAFIMKEVWLKVWQQGH